MIIGIDMGHSISGAGSGAVGIVKEVTYNRLAGKRLMEMLKEKGHTVIDCTVDYADSTSKQLTGITNKANAQKLDVFVSLHLNAGKGNGTETYIHPNTGASNKTMAKRVNDKIVSILGYKDRGVKTHTNLWVLNNTKAPAMLVELCFCDNQSDIDKWNTEKMAQALFEGITNTSYRSVASTSNSTPNDTVTVTASALNIRESGNTTSKIIATVPKGTVLKVKQRYSAWTCVYYGTGWGYVSNDYIVG